MFTTNPPVSATVPGMQEALIHLGAKFSPCMRQDPQVHSFIHAAREREKHSACCVRNDRSGCVQTSEEECSVSARPQLSSHPCLHLVSLGLRQSWLSRPKPLVLSTPCRPSVQGPSPQSFLLIPSLLSLTSSSISLAFLSSQEHVCHVSASSSLSILISAHPPLPFS